MSRHDHPICYDIYADARALMLNGFPGNNISQQIETVVYKSSQMFIGVLDWEWPSNEIDLAIVIHPESFTLVRRNADRQLGTAA